jgi:hypothetical protein
LFIAARRPAKKPGSASRVREAGFFWLDFFAYFLSHGKKVRKNANNLY